MKPRFICCDCGRRFDHSNAGACPNCDGRNWTYAVRQETTADFKERLARLLNGGALPVRHVPDCLRRRPSDRGFYPPKKKARRQ